MTIKEKQKLLTRRRDELVQIALKNGAIDRVNRMLSANYLLHSQSACFLAEIEEILDGCGLRGGKLVSSTKTLNKAFDAYFDEFAKLVSQTKAKDYWEDLGAFEKIFRKFAQLEDEFVPKGINNDK